MGDLAGTALASSYRRTGQREEAVRVWREMISAGRGGVIPYVELAKYEEHVRRDPAEALKLTEAAMIRLSEPALGRDDAVQEIKNELQYRRQRLLRKLKEREQWDS
jgi:pentatricopeptide repeat protein